MLGARSAVVHVALFAWKPMRQPNEVLVVDCARVAGSIAIRTSCTAIGVDEKPDASSCGLGFGAPIGPMLKFGVAPPMATCMFAVAAAGSVAGSLNTAVGATLSTLKAALPLVTNWFE